MTDISEWMEAKAKKNKSAEGEEDAEIGRNALLDGALRLAARGWEVFPCKPDGSKAPLVPGGFKSSTMDAACIRGWWTTWPGAWVAVATGERSGIVCLDVDEKPERGKFGGDTLEAMEEIHGKMPDTVEAMTAGGGRHLLFNHPGGGRRIKSTVEALGNGLDTRADGGYIIVCPSPGYEWEASNPKAMADCPQWILDVVETSGQVVGLHPSDRALEAVPIGGDELARVSAALAVLVTVDAMVKYDPWLHVGMALHEGSGGSQQGFELWDQWSMQIDGYVTDVSGKNSTQRKWASFGRRDTSIGMGTLFDMARENGYRDSLQVEREEVRSAQEEKWKKDQERRPEVEPTVETVVGIGAVPSGRLEVIRQWFEGEGFNSAAACAGTLAVAGALAARKWETVDGGAINLFQALLTDDVGAARDLLEACEVLMVAVGREELVHQERIEGHVQVRKGLWHSPSCLLTSDTLSGMTAGGQSAIRRKSEQGHADLVRYGHSGRDIHLTADGLQGILGKCEKNNRRAVIRRPAISVLATMGRGALARVYQADMLGSGNIEPYLLVDVVGARSRRGRMTAEEGSEVVVSMMEWIEESSDILTDGNPEMLPNVRRAEVMGHQWGEDDLSVVTEESGFGGGGGAAWVRAMERAAVDNVARVTAILAAWNGGTIGQEGADWAAHWVSRWYRVTLGVVSSVGGSTDGRLTLLEQVVQAVMQAGDAGMLDSQIGRVSWAWRKASKDERAKVMEQLLVIDKVLVKRKAGRARSSRLYIRGIMD